MTDGGAAPRTAVPYDAVKRSFDIVGAVVLLVVLAPVQLIAALLVRVRLGSPVIFRQPRPGRGGRVFTLLKFRTMRPIDVQHGIVDDAVRLTPFGKALRATSVDELPSLWNVLVGDMSMVGPRPLLVEYLPLYTPAQARRHEVRPGVTGLAQVSGRNALGWDEKFRLDVEYVDRRSFSLDVRILFRTVTAVLRRKGVSQSGHVTMAPFRGANES